MYVFTYFCIDQESLVTHRLRIEVVHICNKFIKFANKTL